MLNLSVTTVIRTALTALWWLSLRLQRLIVYKMLFELVVVIEFACGFCDTSAASRQIHTKYIFYFIFYFYLIMFIYHLLKTIKWIKGLLEKVCNMLYKYSLSETFRICIAKMLSIYTSLPHWNTQCMFDFGKACASVIWRQYSVNCMASRSPPRQFNWVDFTLLISWRLFSRVYFPASVIHAQVLVFSSEKRRNIHWLFSFLFSLGCILRTNNHLLMQQ